MTRFLTHARRFATAAALSAAVALAGCVSYEHLYDGAGILNEIDAEVVGKDLYENHCTLCHAMFQPSSYGMTTWDKQIRRYGAKAGLTKEQRTFVRLYLDSHAPDGERRLRLFAERATHLASAAPWRQQP